MPTLATLDWMALGVLLLSLLLGLWRGLVFEVLSLLNWLAAFVLAQWVTPEVWWRLPLGEASPALRYVLAFLLVFVAAMFIGGFFTTLMRHMVALVGLRPVDRGLGGLFGVLRGLVLLLALAAMISHTPYQRANWWRESHTAALLMAALDVIKPWLSPRFDGFFVR